MARSRLALLLAAAFLLAAAAAPAQNRYFADGASGPWFGLVLLFPDHADGYGADLTYTFRTQFDLGIGVSRAQSDWGGNEATEISPHVGFALVRPTAQTAFGFDLTAGYSFADLESPALEALGRGISARGYVLGGEGYAKLGETGSVQWLPAIGLAYGSVTTTVDQAGASEKTTVGDVMVTGSLTLLVDKVFTLGGGFQEFDDDMTWFIGIGFVFAIGGS